MPELSHINPAEMHSNPSMGGFVRVLGMTPKPPTITVLFVAGLAHPDFLLEVHAVAVLARQAPSA